jgi:hypothetical protein
MSDAGDRSGKPPFSTLRGPGGQPPPQPQQPQPPPPQFGAPQPYPPQPPPPQPYPPQPPPPPPQFGAPQPYPPQPPPPQLGAPQPYPPQPPPPQLGAPQPYPEAPAGIGFFGLSLKRAFRLDIHPDEVLPGERAALIKAGVTSVPVQAYLAWRRSLMLVIAIFMVPHVVLRAVEVFDIPKGQHDTITTLFILQWFVELLFTGILWLLLPRWTQWHSQRRALLFTYIGFFLVPFAIYLFPLRSLAPAGTSKIELLGIGIIGGVQAMLTLAPKAVSLMPGMLRASIAAKLLFPGASAPGWLMVMAAPIYALLVYVVLLMPYQLTGNGLFVLAVAGFIGAQIWLARSGYALARPLTPEQSRPLVRRARMGYLTGNLIGALFVFIALIDLVDTLEFKPVSIINIGLALLANVFLLTLIATDLVLVGLDRARTPQQDAQAQAIRADYERKIEEFHL